MTAARTLFIRSSQRKAEIRLIRGRYAVRIRFGKGERVMCALPFVVEEDQAEVYADAVLDAVTRLLAAGLNAYVPAIVKRVGHTPAKRLDEIEERVTKLIDRRSLTTKRVGLPTTLYFVADHEGHIKIGMASDLTARIAVLQNAHARPLTLLATMVGAAHAERQLHRRFATDRVRGEWFRPSAALLLFIESLKAAAA
jgi:hypothetical protein